MPDEEERPDRYSIELVLYEVYDDGTVYLEHETFRPIFAHADYMTIWQICEDHMKAIDVEMNPIPGRTYRYPIDDPGTKGTYAYA